MNSRSVASIVALAAAVLTGALLSHAGPLSPPTGAPAPTYKTLGEVEPRIPISAATTPGDADSLFKITQPGSYYLTGNLTGVSGKHGIEISASGVTLDLMGYQLLGAPGSFDAVTVTAPITNLAVVNGAARGWGGDGFLIAAANTRLSGLLAANNGGAGIDTGINAVVTSCAAYQNEIVGIKLGLNGVMSTCSAWGNAGIGISLAGSRAVECAAIDNDGGGIVLGSRASAVACRASSNGVYGIGVTNDALVSDCSARANAGPGILVVDSDNRIEGNTCTDNTVGIEVTDFGNYIVRNACSGNTTGNFSIVGGNITGTIVTTEAALNAANNSNVNVGF